MPLSHVVRQADTAIALGSGDVPMLATPRLIAWLEAATVAACPDLGADETSVGTRVDVQHLAASPIGASVEAAAEIVHRDGRLIRFSVVAHHDVGEGPVMIASGQVTRVVVRRGPFLERSAPALVIRRALPEEFDAVGELRVEAYVRGYGMADGETGYAAVLREVSSHAAQAEVLVALRDGELVGTVTVVPAKPPLSGLAEVAGPGEVEFRFMAVSPTAWRQGIARALMDAVIARAGSRPLVCSVIVGNDPATTLYASYGFEPAPDRDREVVPGVYLRAYRRLA
jgi:predicted thioesterase/GNAT superfamily N-acetyltransferase